MAMKLKKILVENGCSLWLDSPTNQQFVVLDAAQRKMLEKKESVEIWEEREGGGAAGRFATSCATNQEDLDELDQILQESKGA